MMRYNTSRLKSCYDIFRVSALLLRSSGAAFLICDHVPRSGGLFAQGFSQV
jgi:hypothetical protein